MSVQKNSGRVQMKGVGVPMTVLAASLGKSAEPHCGGQDRVGWRVGFSGGREIEPVADSLAPSIFTGVREQLGLRLVPQKGPVDMLVIDHEERPSEN